MKRIHMTAGWLVVAAALTTGMTACSGDDNAIEEPPIITTQTPKTSTPTDLSTLADGEYVAQDGEVLTGTLDGETQKVKVCIAPGAIVTLHDATISGKHYSDTECLWAGITALGDATIVLEGSNRVRNFNRDYPAIQPAHNDSGSGTEYTLTIRGSGGLTATNDYFGAAIGTKCDGGTCGNIAIEGGTVTAQSNRGAAIGASAGSTCGSISISGGTVTATGGNNGAGIGSGYGEYEASACGSITISGGTVTATGGGHGAGIGTGYLGTCGSIDISGGTVTATGGNNGAGIGTGWSGTCGSIDISGGTVTATGGNNATGIGTGQGSGGQKAVCGDISIRWSESFVSVTAVRGSGASRSIGTKKGYNNDENKCGRIMFSDEVVLDGADDDYYDMPGNGDYGGLRLEIMTESDGDDGTDDKDNTWTLTPR